MKPVVSPFNWKFESYHHVSFRKKMLLMVSTDHHSVEAYP
ncbi:hypothetical protein bthur0005_53200 [Bacillus thuringiensis serovar pakistani str. T13001]|nr:hypothetical protein bthur0005_53200 [Bacillus thuringiensis serovar pakistani str. T13001]